MENLIFCKGDIHFKTDKTKIAKKYCSLCEIFICNSCALDNHSEHIDKIIKLNMLFNHTNQHEIMNKFLALPTITEQNDTNTMNSVSRTSISSSNLKCMNFVFHEAKYYCLDCKGFLCEKCKFTTSNGHNSNDHKLILIQNYFAHVKEKIEFFNFVMTSCSKDIILGESNMEVQKIQMEFQNIFENEIIEQLFSYKEIISNTIKNRMLLSKNIFDELSKFFICKQVLIESKKKEFNGMQKIYEKIKFEKTNSKIYEIFIQFENLIDSIISQDEAKKIKYLYNNLKNLNDLILEYNKGLKVKFQEEVILEIKKIFSNFEHNIEDNKINFKNITLDLLKLNEEEYDRFMFNEKEKEKIYDLEFFERVSKFNTCNNKYDNSRSKINILEIDYALEKLEILQISNKIIDNKRGEFSNLEMTSADSLEIIAQPYLINSKEFMESEIVEIYVPENIRRDFIKSQMNVNIQHDQEEEQIYQEEKRMTIDSEFTQFTNFDLKFKNLPVNKNIKICELSDDASEKELEIISFENNIHTGEIKSEKINDQINQEQNGYANEQIYSECDKINVKLNDDIRDSFSENQSEIKLENDTKEEKFEQISLTLTEPTLKEKIQKINDISELTWEERNKIEMISIGYNTHSTFIYNPLSNEVKEVEFSQFKFPTFHCFINLLPWVYISGGKDSSSKDLNNFYKIRRTDQKSFETVDLAQMNEKRSNHSMIYYKQNNSLYVISGSKIKSCEKYSIDENNWSIIPSLNHSREKPGLCIYNDEYLYVILGYDRSVNKYVSNFERLKIKDNSSIWEIINVKGSQSLLKKQALCCYKNASSGIYLIGGVNALRNETKEILSYDFNTNSINQAKFSLNFNASFNQIEMIKLEDVSIFENIFFNFSENFEVVKFHEKNLNFIN